MTEQSYGSHAMTEANYINSGKVNQSTFKNNLTRRNLNILERTPILNARHAPKKLIHFIGLSQLKGTETLQIRLPHGTIHSGKTRNVLYANN